MISSTKIKRPRWGLLIQFWAAITIAILTSTLVIFIMKKSIWIELETAVSLLSIFYLAYTYILIFKGVRINKHETYSIDWKPFDTDRSWMNMLGPVDTYGAFATAGAEAGPLGCIAGLLLDLVVSFSLVIAIAFLLWLGMNVITTGVLILFLPVYILFRRSLRAAIVKGRTCHGQVMKSLGYAAWTTFISMSWLYVVIYLGHVVHEWMK